MKEKALKKVSGTGKRIARRLKEFKKEGVKPVGCLKHHLGCHKTEHFFYNVEKGTVRCNFEKKEGCFSTLHKKKPEEKKIKKHKKDKTPTEKKSSEKKKKGRRKKGPKFTQIEFEVAKPPPDKAFKSEESEHINKKINKKLQRKSLGL